MMTPLRGKRLRRGKASSQGFSLLELLVAMGVFLTVSAVAFTLFNQQQSVLSQEQVTVGLNIGLRNALAQVQLDVANAGNGMLVGGINIPSWPVGVTIVNNSSIPATPPCNPTASSPPVYTNACFDQMNLVLADPNTPSINPCAGTGCSLVTSSGGTITLSGPVPVAINPNTNQQWTASDLAQRFKSGDQVLFVQSCAAGGGHTAPGLQTAANSSGCAFTTAILASGGTPAVGSSCPLGCVSLTFNSTLTPPAATNPPTIPPPVPFPGSNTVCPTPTPSPNTCNDPLNMTTYAPYTELTDTFGANDWVVRLSPITYSVNANHTDRPNQQDPQLMRTQAGVANVLMDQVVGFNVGAALWNNNNTSTFQYYYNAANYTTGANPVGTNAYQYNLIRSVRVSIIGRTEPNPQIPYRNLFDKGPYQIRGNSIVVDPRNLTMNSD